MGNLRKTFVGGRMEKDTDERLVQDGFYRHAENVLILDTEGSDAGAIQNSLSNRKLTNLNLGANIFTLFTLGVESIYKIYWGVKSDSGCYIVEYDVINDLVSKVLEDTRVGVNRVLDFKETHLITAVDVIISLDNAKNLMIINDDNLQPLCFNIERAKTYGPNGFDKEDIFLIKKPPRFAPKIQPTFINNASNYMEENFLSFSYKYQYLDGEYSALSSSSNYVFYPGKFKLDYEVLDNLGMVNIYNAARVTLNTGDKRVTDIQCVVKASNSNNRYIIETFNKENEGWGHNEERSFIFANDKIYTVLPSKEAGRLSDYVPLKAKAQTVIGNILVMGNFEEGYNLIDKYNKNVNPKFNLSVISNPLEGTELNITLNTSGDYASDSLYFDLTGKELKEGSKITLFVSLQNNQAPTASIYSNNFEFLLTKNYVDAIELAQDPDFVFFVEQYMTNTFISNYTITPIANSVFEFRTMFSVSESTVSQIAIKTPKLVYRVDDTPTDPLDNPIGTHLETIFWKYNTDTNVLFYEIGSVSTVKTNRSLEVGIIYMDEFGRETTVQTQINNTIFIPHELALSKNTIKVSLSSLPPIFADRYKFVVKQRRLQYQTIYSTIFYSDGLFRWVKLENDNKDKVKVGDVLIFKSDTDGFVPTLNRVKVLEIVAQPKDFITGNIDPKGGDISELPGTYMKIKIPAGISMDYKADSFQEYTGNAKGKGDNFNMLIGPFTNEAGDIPITQGSRIDIELHNVKYGSSGDSKDFTKTYYASTDYANFKSWYDAEVSGTGTSPFSYTTNGVVTENAKLYLQIHNELNGNGQHKSYMNGTVKILAANGLIIFETEEPKSVNEEIYYATQQTFEIVNGFHKGNLQNQTDLLSAEVELDFFNCFCQANGAESYIIKDAFNKEFLNIDLRPSLVSLERYKAVRRFADMTFGEAYVESSNQNGLNVFNRSTLNTKELDKQYGSIQKLHSRDNDILILKEQKPSKVMFEKGLLYNSDGSSNVSATNNTLGPEVTYLGSKGIGKHPESFAVNDYQVYYANPIDGEINRLSLDGTTPIVSGMSDWFRDIFRTQPNAKMLGGYDPYTSQYVFSIGNEPERLLRLNCSNEIIKENQKGSFTYELKLNDLSGDVVLNYNIMSGNATIVADFAQNNYVVSNVTGIGNLTFSRNSLVDNIVVVTITAIGGAINYSIGNICPIGSQLKIVSIVLNEGADIGKNVINSTRWGTSSLYDTDDVFNSEPISKFLEETGIEGVGKFPLNNSVFSIQSLKNNLTSGAFLISKCNRLGYLITKTIYSAADIDTITAAATFVTVNSSSEIGFSETRYGNFLFNRSNTNQRLYLIWDYKNRNPKVSNDFYTIDQGDSIICDVKSNDDNLHNETLEIVNLTAPMHGTLAINPDGTITYTNDDSFNNIDSFTYSLSNGSCISEPAVVTININVKVIYPYKWIASEPYCEQETFACLSSMEIILRYAHDSTPTSDGLIPVCAGGHACNRAAFYLQGNTTTIGNFSLNNIGGPEDLLNYPPGVTSGSSRYNSLVVTPEQALEMASTSTDGFIDFKITPQVGNTSPHVGVTWIIFKLNDEIILQTCRDTAIFRVNPCTGDVIEL